ncbi:7TM diverse intracellular signaling domain-containing protein [Larkinella harenae]
MAQIELTGQVEKLPISLQAEFLEDSSCRLTLRDVQQAPYSHRFVRVSQKAPNFGFNTSPFWIRFSVHNNARDSLRQWVFEQAFQGMGTIDLYLIDQQGKMIHKRGGDLAGRKSREIASASYSFLLPLKPGSRTTVYVRMWPYSGQAFFPIYIKELLYFEHHNQLSILIWGAYYGLLLAAFLYHILLWLFTRQKGFLFLSAYLAIYFIYEINRGFSLAQQYLWPTNEWMIVHGLGTFFTLMVMACVLFYTYAFNYRSLFPYSTRFLTGLLVVIGLLRLIPLLYPTVSQNLIGICQFLPASSYLLFTGILSLRHRHLHTRLYFYSLICIIGGGMLFTLNRSGILPGDDFLVHYTLNLGSILEIIFMSFGVAYAMRQEQQNRQLTEHKAQTAFMDGKAEEHHLVSMMLHHEVGNNLITMQRSIEKLVNKLDRPITKNEIKRLDASLQETYKVVREWSYFLTPETVLKHGLTQALKRLVERLNQNQPVSFLLLLSDREDQLPVTTQFELYYICLELTNNIMKHAQATEASIHFFFSNQHLNMEVRDDGVGFTAQSAAQTQGAGWSLIENRINRINAVYTIQALPEQGTKITIKLPLL